MKTGLPLSLELGPGILDGIYVFWRRGEASIRVTCYFACNYRVMYAHDFCPWPSMAFEKESAKFWVLKDSFYFFCMPHTLQSKEKAEDGIQRPLERIQQLAQSVFVPRGVDVPNLDRDKLLGLRGNRQDIVNIVTF